MRPRIVAWGVALGAGVAVFASIAAGFSVSDGESPSVAQVALAAVASVLSGALAWSQTRQRSRLLDSNGDGDDRATGNVPRQLPADLADFTTDGSYSERVISKVAEVRRASSTVPALVAVSGPPGVGKTTLIVHSAHQLRRHYPDGQLFVNLGGGGAHGTPLSGEEALALFLRALGVDGSQIPLDADERAALFRARLGNRRMLIVLDNAVDEAQVRPLLPGGSPCCVLISSRNRLAGLESAIFVNMVLMAEEHSLVMLGKVGGRRRLEADPASARELVRLCGCLPLALRIVGAKLATRPQLRPAHLVTELRECQDLLGELQAGDLGVEASFALSYGSLDALSQLVFRRLGIIDTATFPAWVCPLLVDRPDVEGRRLLRPLVDAQLVEIVEAADDFGRPRYRVHDLVRMYTRKLLAETDSAAERAAAERRYVAGYLRLARVGAEVLEPGNRRIVGGDHGLATHYFAPADLPGGSAARALHWFEEERRGLVRVAEQALRARLYPLVWELASALRPYFDYTSTWDDWTDTHRLAIRAAEADGETFLAAASRCNLAHAYRDAWSWDEADAELDRCEQVFAELGDSHWQGFARLERGLVLRGRAAWEDAVVALREAAALFAEKGDIRSKAIAVHYEADIFRDQGDGVKSKQRYDACLPLFTELDDARWIAITELDLGLGERKLRDPRQAIRHFETSLRVFEVLNDRRLHAYAVHGLADCRLELGEHTRAVAELEWSQATFAEIGDRLAEGYVWFSLATAHHRAGRASEGEGCLQRAESFFQEADEAKGRAMVAFLRAEARAASGDAAGAAERFGTVVAAFAEVGDLEWRARALLHQGEALAAAGRPDEARPLWREAAVIFRSNGSKRQTEVVQLLAEPGALP